MTSTMDLLREGDAGTRILTARHISADNAVKGLNNGVNTSLLCHSYSVQPDFGSYLAGKRNSGKKKMTNLGHNNIRSRRTA